MAQPKKVIPEDLMAEMYRLRTQESWTHDRIGVWLADKGHSGYSREWVRKRIEEMEGAEGIPLPEGEPEELDEDAQLRGVQCDVYRAARRAYRMGDVGALCNAAKAHVNVVLARRKLKEPVPAGDSADSGSYVNSDGVKIPMFKVSGHGSA